MGGIYFFIVLIVFFVVYEVESFRYRSSTKDKIKKSFEEQIPKNELQLPTQFLSFCIPKNAIRLLEHVGFPNEIIHTAKNLSLF